MKTLPMPSSEILPPSAVVRRRRWCLGTRVLVALALLWLAFAVAQRLLSGHWWFWLLVDVLPPLLLVAVPVLLVLSVPVLLLCRVPLPLSARSWVLAAAVSAGLLGFGQSGINVAALAGTPDGAAPAGALHVFVWNTQYWDQTDDPDRFYPFLRAQHADVYLLQEYLNWDDSKDDQGARPVFDQARLRREFPGYTVVARGELLTLSRFPVIARPPVGPDRAIAGIDVDWQTVFRTAKVLRTDLLVYGRVVSFYNVHLPVQVDTDRGLLHAGFYDYTKDADGARQAQLAGLSADVGADPHPTVVAGDFNTSPAMGDLDGLRGTMRDAVRADPSVYPVSWQSSGWRRFWRLDWTFTTRGMRVYHYAFGDADGMSDHRPQDLVISPPG
jgi:endonuclease/exonuclease/phosphatase family metal-dependent hydrolase